MNQIIDSMFLNCLFSFMQFLCLYSPNQKDQELIKINQTTLQSNFTNMNDETSPPISKLASVFFEHLKWPEIYIKGHLINCQLILGLSDYDCIQTLSS